MKIESRHAIHWMGMNLLAAIFVSFLCAALMAQGTGAAGTSQSGARQDRATASAQSAPPASQSSPSATSAKTSASPTQNAAHRRRHRKKPAGNCDSPAAGQTTSGSAGPGSPTAGTPPVPTIPPPTNCPPPKIVVRQGGSPEPSIQLGGGTAGDQASHQHDTDQMLGETDTNLKRIGDRQLTQSQQDMVSQIRQFMDQSKTAVEAGDIDRARTLAWKAQVLSEELVKPEK